jgi:DNA-binding transcriptional LysR family regulator
MVTMRQLEAFCAVIDHQTVTEAARAMRLSQPAVSKLVATLEQDTRLALFRRDRRRLVPTEEGLILHRQAQAIFARLHDIERLSEELRNLAGGRLNIVTMMALGRTFLPDAMSAFLRERPAVVASLHVRSSRTVVDQIAAHQADLGFTMLASDDPGCRRGCCADARRLRPAAEVTRWPRATPSRPATWRASASSPSASTAACAATSTACSRPRGVAPAHGRRLRLGGGVQPRRQRPGRLGGRALHRLGLRAPGQVVARPFRPDVVFEFRMLRPAGRPPSLLAEAFAAQVERMLAEHIQRTGAETVPEGTEARSRRTVPAA